MASELIPWFGSRYQNLVLVSDYPTLTLPLVPSTTVRWIAFYADIKLNLCFRFKLETWMWNIFEKSWNVKKNNYTLLPLLHFVSPRNVSVRPISTQSAPLFTSTKNIVESPSPGIAFKTRHWISVMVLLTALASNR